MKRRHLATLLALLAAFAAHGGEVGADEAKWPAVYLDRLLCAIESEGELSAPEAYERIEDLAAFGYTYNDNLLSAPLPEPAIEVTDVAPGAMRFRLVDAGDADGSAAELATRDIPVTLEVGSTPGTLEPVEATPTLVDGAAGVFEVTVKEEPSAPTRFFRLRARPNP